LAILALATLPVYADSIAVDAAPPVTAVQIADPRAQRLSDVKKVFVAQLGSSVALTLSDKNN
jgi:hypothetical protein